jgi:hypothetical protein
MRELVDREYSKREIGDRQHDEEQQQATQQQRHDKCRFACVGRHAGHRKRGECGDGEARDDQPFLARQQLRVAQIHGQCTGGNQRRYADEPARVLDGVAEAAFEKA